MRRLLLFPILFLVSCLHTPATAYSRMVDRVSASIVRVTIGDEGVCTGEVITQNRVLTAGHCTPPGLIIAVDGVRASVIKRDEYYDLAFLSVETQKPTLGMRKTPVVRFEHVTALGYGFGWTHLSVLHVPVFLIDETPAPSIAPGLIVQGSYIQGMSGGPVVDEDGRMVGIVQQTNAGVGYGVGVLFIRAFLVGT